MHKRFLIRFAVSVVALFFTFAQNSAFADEIAQVTVNTSGLGPGNSEVFFFLTGVGNNTATLTSFSLGGGTAGAVDNASTSGSGTKSANGLGSAVSLDDSTDFLNVFAQSFMAGSKLSFLLDLTTNVASPNPDQFALAILDPTGNPIPTSDPTGFDNLLTINIDSGNPTPNIYSNLVSVSAPTVTPEPSSVLLLGIGMTGFLLWRARRAPFPGWHTGSKE